MPSIINSVKTTALKYAELHAKIEKLRVVANDVYATESFKQAKFLEAMKLIDEISVFIANERMPFPISAFYSDMSFDRTLTQTSDLTAARDYVRMANASGNLRMAMYAIYRHYNSPRRHLLGQENNPQHSIGFRIFLLVEIQDILHNVRNAMVIEDRANNSAFWHISIMADLIIPMLAEFLICSNIFAYTKRGFTQNEKIASSLGLSAIAFGATLLSLALVGTSVAAAASAAAVFGQPIVLGITLICLGLFFCKLAAREHLKHENIEHLTHNVDEELVFLSNLTEGKPKQLVWSKRPTDNSDYWAKAGPGHRLGGKDDHKSTAASNKVAPDDNVDGPADNLKHEATIAGARAQQLSA